MVNFYPDFINCTLDNVYGDDNRTASISQLAGQLYRQVICTGRSSVHASQLYRLFNYIGQLCRHVSCTGRSGKKKESANFDHIFAYPPKNKKNNKKQANQTNKETNVKDMFQ